MSEPLEGSDPLSERSKSETLPAQQHLFASEVGRERPRRVSYPQPQRFGDASANAALRLSGPLSAPSQPLCASQGERQGGPTVSSFPLTPRRQESRNLTPSPSKNQKRKASLPCMTSGERKSSANEPVTTSGSSSHRTKRKHRKKVTISNIPQHLLLDMGSIRSAVSLPGARPCLASSSSKTAHHSPPRNNKTDIPPELTDKLQSYHAQHIIPQSQRTDFDAVNTSHPSPSVLHQRSSPATLLRIREHCMCCAPPSPVSGILTATAQALTFEPDIRSQLVRDMGIGKFQVYIDIQDVIACAMVMLPNGPLVERYFGFAASSMDGGALPGWGGDTVETEASADVAVPTFFQLVVKVPAHKGFSPVGQKEKSSTRFLRHTGARRGSIGPLAWKQGDGGRPGVPILHVESTVAPDGVILGATDAKGPETGTSLLSQTGALSSSLAGPTRADDTSQRMPLEYSVGSIFRAQRFLTSLSSWAVQRRISSSIMGLSPRGKLSPVTDVQYSSATENHGSLSPRSKPEFSTPCSSTGAGPMASTPSGSNRTHDSPASCQRTTPNMILMSPQGCVGTMDAEGSEEGDVLTPLSSSERNYPSSVSVPSQPRRSGSSLERSSTRHNLIPPKEIGFIGSSGIVARNQATPDNTKPANPPVSSTPKQAKLSGPSLRDSSICQRTLLFWFSNHNIVRDLTRFTMEAMDQRDALNELRREGHNSVVFNSNEAKHQVTLLGSPTGVTEPLSLSATKGTSRLSAVPFTSDAVFNAFLLSTDLQTAVLAKAEAYLSSTGRPQRTDTRALVTTAISLCQDTLLTPDEGSTRFPLIDPSIHTTDSRREKPKQADSQLQHSASMQKNITAADASRTSLFSFSPTIEQPDPYSSVVLMTEAVAAELAPFLPTTLVIRVWKLAFCTQRHGISYQTFYRKLDNCGPAIILVCDTKGTLFGGFSPVCIRESSHYYGTGECFVFTFKERQSENETHQLSPVTLKRSESRDTSSCSDQALNSTVGAMIEERGLHCEQTDHGQTPAERPATVEQDLNRLDSSLVLQEFPSNVLEAVEPLHNVGGLETCDELIESGGDPVKTFSTRNFSQFSTRWTKAKIFSWTTKNPFFLYSDARNVAFGGGGSYALTIDSTFLRGSSQPCSTFRNPCLASSEDFLVRYFQLCLFIVDRMTGVSSIVTVSLFNPVNTGFLVQ